MPSHGEYPHKSMIGGTPAASIPANLTRYVCVFGGTAYAAETNVRIRIPFNGIARNLRAYAPLAPGAGETFTYTLIVNGVPSVLTCTTVNPDTESQDLVNEVRLIPNDEISMRIITSLAAIATVHTWCFEVVALD